MNIRDNTFAAHAADWVKAKTEERSALMRLESAQRDRADALERVDKAAAKLGEFVGRNIPRKLAIVGDAAVIVDFADRPGGLPHVSIVEAVTFDPNRSSST